MDEIILQLLNNNGRVILPEFGALIEKQQTPFVVIFNEFLQYNDGVLTTAIEEKFSLSKEEATQKVKDLISDFNQRLNNGEEINLVKIGILSKTKAGKITLTDVNTQKDIPQKAEPVAPKIKTPEVEFDMASDKAEEKPNAVLQQKATPIVAPAEKPKIPEPVKKPIVEEKKEKVISSANTITTQPTRPKVSENINIQTERSKTSIFLWVLIIILVNGSIIGYFVYNNQTKSFFGKKAATSGTNIIVDTLKIQGVTQDTTLTTTPEPNVTIEEPKTEQKDYHETSAQLTGTKYYIVAGVFREEANADKKVKALRLKGFNAEKFGKIGQMFGVCYDAFQSKSEAESYLAKIKKDSDPGAWIKVVN
jgi:nucleoid DNA-binding protein